MNDILYDAIRRLDRWVEMHHWQAYDPFDGLNSWLRPLALGKRGRQALMQAVKRFPWNLRPLLGIPPATSSKGMGYFVQGYLRLYRVTSDTKWLDKARYCLNWLREHPSSGYSGLCWGNHFDYQSRVFWLPKGTPTVVWTAHIGYAFLEAWEFLGDEDCLEAARSVCQFIIHDLERRPDGSGVCISYIPGGYYAVHNANMLAAAMLARTYAHTKEMLLKRVATEAVAYTVGAQRPDGSWRYGEDNDLHWVDNFHTGYVLDSLQWYAKSTGDQSFMTSFQRGAEFYVTNFFLDDGIPKYYPHSTYPVDIQCVAQAIETLTSLSETYDPACLKMAEQVATWAVTHMQDPDGHFYYQRTRWWINTTPMLHWGQATMLASLSALLSGQGRKNR